MLIASAKPAIIRLMFSLVVEAVSRDSRKTHSCRRKS
jgi:hypothetical protein